jgi:sulfite reductase (ferredoxin)
MNGTSKKKSKVELVKEGSANLRGSVASDLASGGDTFDGNNVLLLKFHGLYQQEDRDHRRSVRQGGGEKLYNFMLRSKVPGGRLTAEQYLIHDALARQFANGTVRITDRQCFQLHGIIKGDLRATLRGINEALVTSLGACGDIARNVMTCPAPLPDRELSGIQGYAKAISDFTLPKGRAYYDIWVKDEDGEKVELDPADTTGTIEDEPLYGTNYLPRKFKMAIAFPGDNCVDLYSQCLGFVPHFIDGDPARGVEGFTMVAGGGFGATHNKPDTYPRLGDPIAFIPEHRLLDAVEAVIGLYRELGDRANRRHARLKYVVQELGVPAFRAEFEHRMGGALPDPRPLTWDPVEDHLGWHRQADDKWFLGLLVENGRIQDTDDERQLTALREIIGRFRPEVRLTPQQNILLCGLLETQRPVIERILAKHGVPLVGEASPTVRTAIACPALPTCGLALAEAERVMPALSREIDAELVALGLHDRGINVRMTGCPNGCARPYVAEIGLVGRTLNRYDLRLGGDANGLRLNETVETGVPLEEIVPRLRPILEAYRSEQRANETFGEFCARQGVAGLQSLAAVPAAD